MSGEEFFNSVSDVVEHRNCEAEFYFLMEPEGLPSMIRRADLNEEAYAELRDAFIDAVRKAVEDAAPVDLSSADERANGVYRYDMDPPPEPLLNLAKVLENDDFELFDQMKEPLSTLKGIIIILGQRDKQLAVYKHHYPIFTLRKGLFSFFGDGTRFEPLRHDILRINASFEFMSTDGVEYIFDLQLLERSFGFQETVKKMAIKSLEKIVASNLLDDVSVLESRLDDVTFTRKLAKSAVASPVLDNGISPEVVVAFALSHPSLSGKILVNPQRNKLLLKTKKAQDLFLRLLNDDFLHSELTRQHYASIAKDPA